jgi:hypothetical protein
MHEGNDDYDILVGKLETSCVDRWVKLVLALASTVILSFESRRGT